MKILYMGVCIRSRQTIQTVELRCANVYDFDRFSETTLSLLCLYAPRKTSARMSSPQLDPHDSYDAATNKLLASRGLLARSM